MGRCHIVHMLSGVSLDEPHQLALLPVTISNLPFTVLVADIFPLDDVTASLNFAGLAAPLPAVASR
jgi:hypothetical protein